MFPRQHFAMVQSFPKVSSPARTSPHSASPPSSVKMFLDSPYLHLFSSKHRGHCVSRTAHWGLTLYPDYRVEKRELLFMLLLLTVCMLLVNCTETIQHLPGKPVKFHSCTATFLKYNLPIPSSSQHVCLHVRAHTHTLVQKLMEKFEQTESALFHLTWCLDLMCSHSYREFFSIQTFYWFRKFLGTMKRPQAGV